MSTEPTNDQVEVELDTDAGGSGTMVRRGAFAAAAGGITAAAVALVAAGRDSGRPSVAAGNRGASSATPAAVPAPRQVPSGDLDIAALAASLEVLAVDTYQSALDAAGSGALGAVPPAVAEFVTKAKTDHQAALDALNGVLTSSGRPAVSAPPADLAASVNEAFGRVTDAGGAAQLALMLEQVAADTYLDAISKLTAPAAITLAGSIFPIDRQHISVLLFALGMYPVPDTFANTRMAYSGTGGMPMQMIPETR